jgi:sugar phosphate isomerase/epimerase
VSLDDANPLRLACPEYRLPGTTIAEKWHHAVEAGFDGIELSGPWSSLESRLRELRAARREGAVFPTVSGGGHPFVGDPDPAVRRAAVANMKRLLAAIAELGGLGATTPASFGLYSSALPSLKPPGGPAVDRGPLVEAVAELAEHAESEGVVLLLEPLNRYEDYLLNRLDQGVELVTAAGSNGVRLLADVFHMNIEEADLAEAVRAAGRYLGHVHLADSNRLEPGAGHLDLFPIFRALKDVGFASYCALECTLSGEPSTILPRVTRHLRALWAAAGRQAPTSEDAPSA